VSFRDDGAAALEWAAQYLERVGEFSVLAQVEPGDIRGRLPASPPDAQLLGLPAGWHGHIEDSASTSTLAALAAAREATGRNVVVCSEHAHSSVDKAAKLLGLELRKIPPDGDFRLRIDALDLADAAAVVATIGTTSTASVESVPAIADACADAGVWLHVDAAYAGSAWVCPELRWSQEGVARADSLVVNAHKW
jgi:aromatic-L-amino-acid/L-tryptophan decarboxylase